MGEYRAEGIAVIDPAGVVVCLCWSIADAEKVAEQFNQLLRDVRVLRAEVKRSQDAHKENDRLLSLGAAKNLIAQLTLGQITDKQATALLWPLVARFRKQIQDKELVAYSAKAMGMSILRSGVES